MPQGKMELGRGGLGQAPGKLKEKGGGGTKVGLKGKGSPRRGWEAEQQLVFCIWFQRPDRQGKWNNHSRQKQRLAKCFCLRYCFSAGKEHTWKFTPGKTYASKGTQGLTPTTVLSVEEKANGLWGMMDPYDIYSFLNALFDMRETEESSYSTRPQVADSEVGKAPTYEWESWYRTHMLFIRNSYLTRCTVVLFAKSDHYTNDMASKRQSKEEYTAYCTVNYQCAKHFSLSLFFW